MHEYYLDCKMSLVYLWKKKIEVVYSIIIFARSSYIYSTNNLDISERKCKN